MVKVIYDMSLSPRTHNDLSNESFVNSPQNTPHTVQVNPVSGGTEGEFSYLISTLNVNAEPFCPGIRELAFILNPCDPLGRIIPIGDFYMPDLSTETDDSSNVNSNDNRIIQLKQGKEV